MGVNVSEGIRKSKRSYVLQLRKNDSCSLEAKWLEDEDMGRWTMYACMSIRAMGDLLHFEQR